MARPNSPHGGSRFEILMEDADGRQLCLEWADEAEKGRARLASLAATYPGMPLILRDRKTQAVVDRAQCN
jgi:hypothetical protein